MVEIIAQSNKIDNLNNQLKQIYNKEGKFKSYEGKQECKILAKSYRL